VIPVLLAAVAAASFGAMTVAIRLGMREGVSAVRASLATLLVAFTVTFVASLVRRDYADAWKFFLAGLLAPGLSQILFTRSVKEVGVSRTSVTVGAAPLFALAIAFTFLGEPVEVSLIVGAVLIVAGGTLLVGERDRPGRVPARALSFALAAAAFFATRDNIIRAIHAHANPQAAAAAAMLAGVAVGLATVRALPTRRELRNMTPAGLCFGLSYLCTFAAYFRGRVSVVSPLIATEALWGIALAAIVFGRAERIGVRVVLGGVVIVAGGVLIGLTAIS
jgi:bacterial/archaeal transporter family protein